MKIRTIAIAACLMLLAACGNKVLVDDERTFDNNVWNRFTPERFDLDIDDADRYFHIDFTAQVDTALFRYDHLPLIVDIYSEDGVHRHIRSHIMLKTNGRWKGEMNDGYREVSTRAYEYFSFNQAGTYRYEVKQATSQYDLEGIHSFKVHIEEAKIDLDKL